MSATLSSPKCTELPGGAPNGMPDSRRGMLDMGGIVASAGGNPKVKEDD